MILRILHSNLRSLFFLKNSFILFFLSCISISSYQIYAQNNRLTLVFEQLDSMSATVFKKNLHPAETFKNRKEIQQQVKKISETLNLQGYLSHHIEIIKQNDTLYKALITYDHKISKIKLDFDSSIQLPDWIQQRTTTVDFSQLKPLLANLYAYYEELGYSFTEIELKEISTLNNQLVAKVKITVPMQRNIDKVLIKGYDNFPKKYIKNYLFLNKNSTFNKETIESTRNALNTLPFIKQTRKPEILFSKDSTQLYIYLQKINYNKFDGLVGFTTNDSGKLQFNGYLDIELNNNFNSGEQLSIKWSNNGSEQERFKLTAKTPYIFNSPISPNVNFEIYKQDSSFINTDLLLEFDYNVNRAHKIGASFLSKSSTNLLVNKSDLLIASFSKLLYGLLYTYDRHKSKKTTFSIQSAFSTGTKTSQDITTTQYYIYLDLSLTERLTKKSSIYLHNRTESLQADDLLQNELFQIGGANTIRGFYEQSIFSSSYNYTNLEYRLLTSNNSYIYTFTDFGITEDVETYKTDKLYSFGLGYIFKTKAGFINLNYAFGKINNSPFDFNQGIFHIKFITLF